MDVARLKLGGGEDGEAAAGTRAVTTGMAVAAGANLSAADVTSTSDLAGASPSAVVSRETVGSGLAAVVTALVCTDAGAEAGAHDNVKVGT